MKDERGLMVKFAKIVERHPEIYDQKLEAYKTRQLDASWEKIAFSVRNELKEECTGISLVYTYIMNLLRLYVHCSL